MMEVVVWVGLGVSLENERAIEFLEEGACGVVFSRP
jgi:hypothetical protein